MIYRRLGRSGLKVSELSFGSWVTYGNQLDGNVPSTPGMDRKAAINFARVGAQKLWAGTVTIHPDAKTGAHHHGVIALAAHRATR